jgi:DNA-binding IclR family transcriptional regulator
MQSLAALSGETVMVTVVSGWQSICVDRIEADRLIKFSIERGRSLPLNAGASSKILLAYQSDPFVERLLQENVLKRFTDKTITDPVLLRKHLKEIRDQGFAYSEEEADLGAAAISAGIFGLRRTIVAALTVGAPVDRMREKKPELVELVIEMAKNASQSLTYSSDRTRKS